LKHGSREQNRTDTHNNACTGIVTPRTLYGELAEATPPAKALEVFPDWQGLLVKSSVLGMSVWVVRDHLHGLALAKKNRASRLAAR